MTADPNSQQTNQGEGNREAAARFNESERQFVESAPGQQKIQQGVHVPPAEEPELKEAEQRAKERAKAQDSGRM
jgi:hypothetical protein